MDDLFIELDQDARVPQTLARIDTKGLPTGVVRIDLSKHYAYQAYSGKQIPVSTAFRVSSFSNFFSLYQWHFPLLPIYNCINSSK
ncbi:unnamed protein product [Schistosoma curassoni]|uniref:UmuC domain-containing protein n=1 Tax=Schistosoma curassoni TaxID=6186 RepID=A0A183L1A0_9TREM|nr:unnamed protein product [Schistosoma curassoni]